MKKLFGFLFVLAFAFVLFACGKEYKIEVPEGQANVTVEKGESLTITPTFTEGETLVWATSDDKVVTVEGGKLTAVEVGKAVITITISGKEDKAKAEVNVTVVPVSVKEITLAGGKAEIVIGEEFTLTATVGPENAANKELEWSTSNAEVATVAAGKVKGIAVGEAKITATAKDGSGKKAEFNVTVSKISVNGVTINGKAEMNVGETQTLTVTVAPSNATNAGVDFASSDAAVLTVNASGLVTAVASGTAKITVTSKDDATKKAEITIVVKTLVEEITIDAFDEMNIGETQTIDVAVDPEEADNKEYELTSSDETILTVDATGKVTAVGEGTAKVIATAKDGSNVKEEFEITVKKVALLDISIVGKDAMILDAEQTLQVSYNPENASYKDVEFKTSDAETVSIDAEGKVKALKLGKATITATTTSDKDTVRTATLVIEVFELTTALAAKGDKAMYVGNEQTVVITTTPATAMQKFDFLSSDPTVASVLSNGVVKALKPGTTTISATAKDGSDVKVELALTVAYEHVYVKLGATEDLTINEVTYKLNEQAFATVAAAIAAVGVGGKVHLLPGEYTDKITIEKGITLTTDLASKNPVEDDADFKDATKAAIVKAKVLALVDNITIEGLTFTGDSRVIKYGASGANSSNFTFKNNYVHDTYAAPLDWKDTNYGAGASTEEGAASYPGFISLCSLYGWMRNTQILNNKFENVSDTNVFIDCTDSVTVIGNVFTGGNREALRFEYGNNYGTFVFEDNIISDFDYAGIFIRSYGSKNAGPLECYVTSNYFKNCGKVKDAGTRGVAAFATSGYQETADSKFEFKYNIFDGNKDNIAIRANVTSVAGWTAKNYTLDVSFNAFLLADANAMINRSFYGSDSATTNYALGTFDKNFYGTDLLTKLEVADANYQNIVKKDATVYNNVYALEKAMPAAAHLPAYTATPTLKTVAEAYALDLNTAVALKGQVSYVYSGGFWLKDETGAIYVYGHADEVKLGDKVEVEGNLYNYKDTKRINFAKVVKVTEAGTYTPEFVAKTEDEFKALTEAGLEITLTNVLVTKISGAAVTCKVGSTEFTINTNSTTEALIFGAYISTEKTLTINALTYFKDGTKAMSLMALSTGATAQEGFEPAYYVINPDVTPYLNVVNNYNDITVVDNMTIYFAPGVHAGKVISETETQNITINKNGLTLQGTEAGAEITCPITIADGVDGLTFKSLKFTGTGYVTSDKPAAGAEVAGIKNVTFNGVTFDGVKSANDGTVHFWVPVEGFNFWNSYCYFVSPRGIRFETTITNLDIDNNEFYGKSGALYDMIRGMAEVLGTVSYTNNYFETTTQSFIWVANVGTAVYTIEGNTFVGATSVSIDFRACAKPTDETNILINIRFNDFSGANGWGAIRLRSQGLKDGQIVANVNFNRFHDIPLGENDYYIDRPTSDSKLTYINCDYNWSDLGEPKSSWFCDQQTSMIGWNLDYLDFVAKFPEYAAAWTSTYEAKELSAKLLGSDLTYTINLSNADKQSGTITNMPVLAAKKNTQYITVTGDFSKYSGVTFILVQWTNKTFTDIHLECSYDGTTWFRCSESQTIPGMITTNKDITAAKAVRVSFSTTVNSNTQLGLRGIALLPADETKVFYANENLLEDLPTSDADYTSTRWTREKYTDAWVAGGTMRSRAKNGVRVTNMDNGYGMTMRWSYNLNGGSLGLANKLSFKVGNYWSNAAEMQVKVKLVDKDGNDHYLIGSATEFGSVPVTTDLVDQALTFDAIDVKTVVFVTKSAVNGSTYLYVGNLLLTYEAPAEQPAA